MSCIVPGWRKLLQHGLSGIPEPGDQISCHNSVYWGHSYSSMIGDDISLPRSPTLRTSLRLTMLQRISIPTPNFTTTRTSPISTLSPTIRSPWALLIVTLNWTPWYLCGTKLLSLISSSLKAFIYKYLNFKSRNYFFIFPAEPSLRDKYHKCFSCNLTNIETKIFKIRVKLEVKVKGMQVFLLLIKSYMFRNGSHHLLLYLHSYIWTGSSEEREDMKLPKTE